MCEVRDLWEDGIDGKLLRADLREDSQEFPHGDRRQELMFIGVGLNHASVQKALDACLLTDAEMELGPDKWEEEFGGEVDKVQLTWGEDSDNDDEEGEEEDTEGEKN